MLCYKEEFLVRAKPLDFAIAKFRGHRSVIGMSLCRV